ncbi:acyltransferase family protein [Chengkuizengella axinellae]|uniref:Acyltransferase family protein n=1 Tax=Chengkuizengella axinellae TaxID=3064388 RepID=A0ABT9J349_9BACL|nr:acyltransferase family protein [Chengkuizengella sp. 2205SS18-9]MDP5275988.1 acyltransferase family protein [Chengkuizengella sp. 2205SS18-9]
MIKEWNLLRVVACLSIVLIHSTTQIGMITGYPEGDYYKLFRILLCYATPTFIILSEMILANRYPNHLPKQFWLKRFKWIYIPFLVFGVIDAIIVKQLYSTVDLQKKMLDNILMGSYEGYFILIILQFYVLHYFVIRFKIPLQTLLPISFIVMGLHLYLLNTNIPFVQEYKTLLKIPFTAWFGYFTIAFLFGKHYKTISEKLLKFKWITFLGVLISAAIIYINYKLGVVGVNSRRLDIFPLTIFVSLAVLAWGQLIPNFRMINLISKYSFGIYLVHWQVQRYIAPYTVDWFHHTFTQVIGLFMITLIITMVLIYFISLLPFGAYIVGKTNRQKKEKTSQVHLPWILKDKLNNTSN